MNKKYKRVEPWERNLRGDQTEPTKLRPKSKYKLGETKVPTSDLSKVDEKSELESLPYGSLGLKVTVAKPKTMMSQIVISQDLSSRSRNDEVVNDTLPNTEGTTYQEGQPYQKRRCAETGLYLDEEKIQREEVRKIIYKR